MTEQVCERSRRRWSRRAWGVCLAAALVWAAGCGGGSGSEDDETPSIDLGVDGGMDAGEEPGDVEPEIDGGEPSDVTRDGSGDADAEADAGPPCRLEERRPEIDRDRDGLRDECDRFPYLNHGGDNVEQANTIQENEVRWPNDSYLDAEENYDLDLPVRIDGSIGPVEDSGDLDHYAIEIEEPTALLMHIEAEGEEFWPGAVLTGREDPNRNKRVQLIGPESGQNATREMFLPAPGQYIFAVSDVRNLISSSSDVGGGEEYDYQVHVTQVPLPEAQQADVPGSGTRQYDERLHVYRLDASQLDGVRIDANGIGVGEQSAHNPVVTVFDPDTERTLAYTLQQQVDEDNQTVSLTTALPEGLDEVYVIDDHFSQTGETSSKLDFTEAAGTSEPETIQSPQDGRADDLAWLQPGVEIAGTIGPPRSSGPTELNEDVDYYLYSAKRGQTVEVTVTPEEGSQLRPELTLGWYRMQTSGGSFFTTFDGHSVSQAAEAGQARSVEFMFTTRTEGEVAFQLRHGPNSGTDFPVGGDKYGYEIELEVVEPDATEVAPIPGEASAPFEAGEIGYYSIDPPDGEIVRLTTEAPGGASLDLRGDLARRSDWQAIGPQFGGVEFHSGSGESFLYAVRDDDGRGTDGQEVTVQVETQSIDPLGELPSTADGSLDSGDAAAFYRFEAEEGERIDARVRATEFDQSLTVFSLPDYRQVGQGSGQAVFRAEQTGTYLARVTSGGSEGGPFRLGVEAISATQPDELPATENGTLDEAPFGDWYKIDISPQNFYQFQLETSGNEEFDGRLQIFDPWEMESLAGGGTGTRKVRPGYDGQLYALVSDADNRAGSDYDYTLTLRERQVEEITPGQPSSGTLSDGQGRMLYLFDTENGGAVDVEVTSQGPWTPRVELVEQGSLEAVEDVEAHNGKVRYGSSVAGSYAVWVEATDTERSGPLEFDISVQNHPMSGTTDEDEPNDDVSEAPAITEFPAAVDGEIGPADNDRDNFSVALQAGQRIWMLPIPHDPDLRYSIRPTLSLHGPGGGQQASNRMDGFGWFPALHAERVPTSGDWTVRLQRWQSQESGSYYLYIFRGEAFSATESEPNNDRSTAQQLGEIDAPARIEATVDSNDPTDWYEFQVKRDLETLRVFLENAQPGHNLVLTDDAGNQIGASGPSHDGDTLPVVTAEDIEAGTYYLQVGQGDGGGSLDVIMWQEP